MLTFQFECLSHVHTTQINLESIVSEKLRQLSTICQLFDVIYFLMEFVVQIILVCLQCIGDHLLVAKIAAIDPSII